MANTRINEDGVTAVAGTYTDEQWAQMIDDLENQVRPDFLERMQRDRELREREAQETPPAQTREAETNGSSPQRTSTPQ